LCISITEYKNTNLRLNSVFLNPVLIIVKIPNTNLGFVFLVLLTLASHFKSPLAASEFQAMFKKRSWESAHSNVNIDN
jgi:hypothetical protein